MESSKKADVATASPPRLNPDLKKILEISFVGSRRAFVFMGFGFNAAMRPDLREYNIEMQKWRIGPMGDAELAAAKQEYKRWTIGQALNELVSQHCNFLDQIYSLCVMILTPPNSPERTKRVNGFVKSTTSLDTKYAKLQADMGVTGVIEPYVAGITKLRHCFVHGGGLVAQRHCNDGDELMVRWQTFDIAVGGVTDGPLAFTEEQLREGVPITMPTVEREQRFALGTLVDLEPSVVYELCSLISKDATAVGKSFVEFCRQNGVTIAKVAA